MTLLLPAHPTIKDPRTGEPLRAIGFTSRGPIWPVMGGSGEGEPATAPATDPPPTAPTPAPPTPTPAPAPAAPAKPAEDTGGKGGKEAVLADLAQVRAENKAMREQFARLGAALGVEAQPKGKTDIEQLTERIAAQEARAAAAEIRALRAEVAQEKGLPAKLAARLNGATKEELAADADELLSLIPAGEKPADGTPSATPDEPQKPKAPAPDPSQGAKGAKPAARPTSLFDAISKANTKA